MTTEMVRYQQPTAMMRFQPETLDDIMQIARMFEASGMFPTDTGKTQSAAQLAVKILAGQELGLTPFAAANGMQIIKGKCTPSANVMAAKVKSSGRYSYRVSEMTDTRVSVDFIENGQPIGTSTFTAADAAKAGTQNMGKFPRNMLFARAISNGAKWFCPDIFNGVAVYTPDEMGATVDYETGEIISMPVEPPPTNGNGHTEPPPVAQDASRCAECNAPHGKAHGSTCSHRTNGNGKPPADEPRPPVPTTAELDAAVAQSTVEDGGRLMADAPSADEALRINASEIVEAHSMKTPADAQKWAVANHYRTDAQSARIKWMDMFAGQALPTPKMQEALVAYVELCLVGGKKEMETA